MTLHPDPADATADATEDAGGAEGFHRVAARDALPADGLLAVKLPDGTAVCLADVDGEVCALRDLCSHQAFPLSAGEVTPDGCIECAWHGARFDARTGEVCGGPACEDVEAFEVRVEGEMIHVRRRV